MGVAKLFIFALSLLLPANATPSQGSAKVFSPWSLVMNKVPLSDETVTIKASPISQDMGWSYFRDLATVYFLKVDSTANLSCMDERSALDFNCTCKGNCSLFLSFDLTRAHGLGIAIPLLFFSHPLSQSSLPFHMLLATLSTLIPLALFIICYQQQQENFQYNQFRQILIFLISFFSPIAVWVTYFSSDRLQLPWAVVWKDATPLGSWAVIGISLLVVVVSLNYFVVSTLIPYTQQIEHAIHTLLRALSCVFLCWSSLDNTQTSRNFPLFFFSCFIWSVAAMLFDYFFNPAFFIENVSRLIPNFPSLSDLSSQYFPSLPALPSFPFLSRLTQLFRPRPPPLLTNAEYDLQGAIYTEAAMDNYVESFRNMSALELSSTISMLSVPARDAILRLVETGSHDAVLASTSTWTEPVAEGVVVVESDIEEGEDGDADRVARVQAAVRRERQRQQEREEEQQRQQKARSPHTPSPRASPSQQPSTGGSRSGDAHARDRRDTPTEAPGPATPGSGFRRR